MERENRFLADLCAQKKRNVNALFEGTINLGLKYQENKCNAVL